MRSTISSRHDTPVTAVPCHAAIAGVVIPQYKRPTSATVTAGTSYRLGIAYGKVSKEMRADLRMEAPPQTDLYLQGPLLSTLGPLISSKNRGPGRTTGRFRR